MAYVLTPHFIPAHQAPQCNPFGFCAPESHPRYYRAVARPQPRRPVYSPYTNFFSQVDELLSEIDREAQRQAHLQAQLEAHREAHRQRQQRKRALRAKFSVTPNEQGWQVDAEMTGFAQENINIEVTNENTLKVAGNTEWRSEPQTRPEVEPVPTSEAAEETIAQSPDNRMDGVTLNDPLNEPEIETEPAPARSTTPDSDTQSHRSYQPTVEDDFEDLGNETSSLISTPSESSLAEPKGKEKVAEEPRNTETAVTQQPQPEVPVLRQQQQQQEEPHPQGSFERTFKFPERIDASNVRASFKDGVLHITVPKAQVQQIKRIAIL